MGFRLNVYIFNAEKKVELCVCVCARMYVMWHNQTRWIYRVKLKWDDDFTMETTINFVATTEQFSPLFYDRIIFDSFLLLLLFFFR